GLLSLADDHWRNGPISKFLQAAALPAPFQPTADGIAPQRQRAKLFAVRSIEPEYVTDHAAGGVLVWPRLVRPSSRRVRGRRCRRVGRNWHNQTNVALLRIRAGGRAGEFRHRNAEPRRQLTSCIDLADPFEIGHQRD